MTGRNYSSVDRSMLGRKSYHFQDIEIETEAVTSPTAEIKSFVAGSWRDSSWGSPNPPSWQRISCHWIRRYLGEMMNRHVRWYGRCRVHVLSTCPFLAQFSWIAVL